MKVLITGIQGYIGVHMAALLQARGHDVTGLDTGFFRADWLYRPDGAGEAPCIAKDIRHVVADDLRGFDAVVHLAELSNDPLGQLNPEVTYDINHRGTLSLARRSKEAGVARFVHSSSCSVYGLGSEAYKTEASETNPQTAYAECKVLAERDVSRLADDGFSPTFLRNATAYGPSPSMRFDLVLNNLCGLAWTLGEIRMTSDGTPWRPLVHVLDLCEAVACVLDAPREAVHNEVFNVGATEENYRVREIAAIVSDTFPGCEVTVGTDRSDARSYRVSFDKIRELLPDFRCRRNVRQGAQELRRLFEKVDLSTEAFESRAYTRLKQLEHLLRTGRVDASLYWT